MTRSIRLALLASAVGAMVCMASALAQQGPGRGGPRGGGFNRGDPVRLLALPEVQKELELVDDQKAQLKILGDELSQKLRKEYTGLRDIPQAQRTAKFAEIQAKLKPLNDEALKKVQEILLPNQWDRLNEISIQVRGAEALGDEKVQKELGLSDDQKSKLTKIRDKARSDITALFQAPRDGNLDEDARRARFAEAREKVQGMIKAASDDAMNVLTAEQRDKFEKMKGAKIEIQFPQRGRGGPGGPGGSANRPAT
jgi:Spy/CpxP family protein refolding chaperone